MIGICDVSVQAANPNMPLYPLRAFVNSPSSLRIRNVPKRIGDWNISSVQLVATYPDNTVKTVECKLIGNVWVGTIAGSSITGRCENGYTVFASGNDENGNPVLNYTLGKGLVEILEADAELKPGADIKYVRIFGEEPENPKDGDVWQLSGAWYIYQDGQSWPIGDDSGLIGQLSAEVQDVENELSTKQDSLTGQQISAIDSVVDERKTVFTIYGEPYIVESDIVGELKASDIPTGPNQVKTIKIGTSVTSIGEHFSAGGGGHSVQGISSLTIPDTIKTIGNAAFQSCHELSGTLTIPDGVESIGNYAFSECNNLDTIEIPASVKTIGQNAFDFTKARIIFKGRTMAEVSAIANYPWGYDQYGIDNSKRVTVYATEELVESGLSAKQDALTQKQLDVVNEAYTTVKYLDQSISTIINNPDTTGYLYKRDIPNKENVVEAKIGRGIKIIGNEALSGCTKLESVMIPDSVTNINELAFQNCSSLTSVTLPASLKQLGNYVFWGCQNLKEVVFEGNKLYNIPGQNFFECYNLEKIIFKDRQPSDIPSGQPWSALSATVDTWNAASQEWVTPRLSYSLLSSGSVQLEDRAVQHVSLELSTTVFTLPQLISSKVNDFVLDVTNTYTEGGTPAAASFSLSGTIGTNFNLVVPKDESFAEMTTLEAGEMAEFYFTRTSFELSGLPTWKVVKQVVDQYTPTAI